MDSSGRKSWRRGVRRHGLFFSGRRSPWPLHGINDRDFYPIPPYLPRLYIDFPLIGSETFPFPVVLNSLALRPNEPRSIISLVEHEESLDARENRALVDRSVTLYQEFFSKLLAAGSGGAGTGGKNGLVRGSRGILPSGDAGPADPGEPAGERPEASGGQPGLRPGQRDTL